MDMTQIMSEQDSTKSDSDIADLFSAFAKELLTEGFTPAEISYAMAATAINIGFQLAPNPESGLSIIFVAMENVSSTHARKLKDETPKDNEAFLEQTAPSNYLLH